MIKRLAALSVAVIGLGAGVAFAQSGTDYFKGKTINYIVATDPGGGYDTNGRLVAEFMQKHLPGSTIVVRNMPGAGQLIGTNYLYGSTADGLTIGTFNTGLIYGQLIADPGIRFDLTKMSWIGKVASDPRVILVSEQSGIKTFEDLQKLGAPVKFATCGVGCASMLESTMLIKSLGLPIELVAGYNGNDDQLALRRGEVQGIIGSRSSFEQFVKEGHGHFIAQIGGSQTDIPQLSSLTTDETALKAIALVASQGNISRLTAAPPGLPEDQLAALRDAYAAATADPEFLAKAETLGLPIDPLVGQAVGDAVKHALDQSPEMVAFLKENMKEK
jgi:tripartite-type tricarboxylate transporter receptor subunit TctC